MLRTQLVLRVFINLIYNLQHTHVEKEKTNISTFPDENKNLDEEGGIVNHGAASSPVESPKHDLESPPEVDQHFPPSAQHVSYQVLNKSPGGHTHTMIITSSIQFTRKFSTFV